MSSRLFISSLFMLALVTAYAGTSIAEDVKQDSENSQTYKFESFQELRDYYFLENLAIDFLSFQDIQNSYFNNKLNELSWNQHMLLFPTQLSSDVVRGIKEIEFCTLIKQKLGVIKIKECLISKFKPTSFNTSNDNHIFQTSFTQLPDKTSLGKVLLLGGVHGNELSSVGLVIKWLNILKQHHSGIFEWNIIPLMNPDGFFNKSSTRTNANGVDLNRNLPTPYWDKLAINYWQQNTSSSKNKYPGPSPASELETQWLIHEIDTFKPDVIISVHSPFNLVDYDARNLSRGPKRLGMLRGKQLSTFPGSLGRYAGEFKNIPVITIELPDSLQLPNYQQIKHIWIDLIAWLISNINVGDSTHISASN